MTSCRPRDAPPELQISGRYATPSPMRVDAGARLVDRPKCHRGFRRVDRSGSASIAAEICSSRRVGRAARRSSPQMRAFERRILGLAERERRQS